MGAPYPAVVVLVEDPAAAGVNLLVALVRATHAQSGIHVHVVTGQIQADQALENNGPPGPGGAQENDQARGRAAVRHHIQHSTKGGRLIEVTRRISIQCVEQTRDAIKQGTCSRVEGHVIKGCDGEDDSEVSCEQALICLQWNGAQKA